MNLDTQLAQLDAEQIIRRIEALELEYMFKHALTQDTVYQSMLKKTRREIHTRVAQTLEREYPDQLDEFAALLARHYAEAGDDVKTIEYATRAGDASARVYANAEAIAHYSVAIDVALREVKAKHLSEPGHAETQVGAMPARFEESLDAAKVSPLGDLYIKRGRAYELASQFPAALENYVEMENRARELNDQTLELGALVAQCQIRCTPSSEFNPSLGEPLAEKALQLARELHDRAAESKILWIQVNLFRMTDRVRQACSAGELSLDIARALNLREQMAYTLNDLSHAYSFEGNFNQSRALIEEAMQLWRELKNLPMLADSLATASMDNNIVGRFDETIAFSEEAYQISQAIGNLWGQTYSLSNLGLAYWVRGETARAIDTMQETLRLSDLSGYPVPKLLTRTDLGIALASVGAFERGLEHARGALAFADANYPPMRPIALGAIIQICLWMADYAQADATMASFGTGDPDSPFFSIHKSLSIVRLASAQAEHARAMELSTQLLQKLNGYGMRSPIPEMLYCKGLAERGLGQVAAARASLAQAQVEAQAMGARWQLWQILGALGELELDCGNRGEAEKLFSEGRALIAYIAEHAPPDLRETYLNSPKVKHWEVLDVEK